MFETVPAGAGVFLSFSSRRRFDTACRHSLLERCRQTLIPVSVQPGIIAPALTARSSVVERHRKSSNYGRA
jgi:hypothetical protein